MQRNDIPETKTNPGLMIGIVFLAVGVALLGAENFGGGIVFIILGVIFLIGYQAAEKKKGRNSPGGFPSEPEIRRCQADSERKLHDEAFAPDGRSVSPAGGTPPMGTQRPLPAQRTEIQREADENEMRKEELRGLLESGIITKEEYRDRMNGFR